MGRECSTGGVMANAYILGKELLGRPSRRWVDNIKMDFGKSVSRPWFRGPSLN
jgi:hypothetical protein